MKPSEQFKRIILAEMHSILKPYGFRKKGSNFQAPRGDTDLLVNLQSSMGTTAEALKVTVNLAVHSRTLAEREGSSGNPSVWTSHWWMRLGELLPEPYDQWWLVEDERQAEQASREVGTLLRDRALPLLESLASTQALANLWTGGRSPGLTDYQRQRYLALANEA